MIEMDIVICQDFERESAGEEELVVVDVTRMSWPQGEEVLVSRPTEVGCWHSYYRP